MDSPAMLSRTGAMLRAWKPLGFWRSPRKALRRGVFLRRGWPKPVDLEEMSWEEREAYFLHIGLDERIPAAVASADVRETETDSRVRGG